MLRTVVLPTLLLWVIAAFVNGAILHSVDLREYERYAHAALRAPVFHSYPTEYPAPAVMLFILPLLLPLAYPWAFAVIVGFVLVALTVSYLTAHVPPIDGECARRLIIYLALGATVVLTNRYDIFAAAAAIWAIRSARRNHWSAAWTWSSVGFVLKLFPAVLWPVLFIAEWRSTGRRPTKRLIWMLSSLFVVAGVPALLNPGSALNALHYYISRPTEIGSLPAGLSLLLDAPHWGFVVSFHTDNAVGLLVGPLSLAFEAAAAAGCLMVWWSQARDRLQMEEACLLSITLIVLGTKVFSTQYIIWLIPFWSLYRLRGSWILAGALNTAVFPFVVSAMSIGYVSARGLVIGITLLNTGRDLAIGFGTVFWLRELLSRRSSPDSELDPVEAVPLSSPAHMEFDCPLTASTGTNILLHGEAIHSDT